MSLVVLMILLSTIKIVTPKASSAQPPESDVIDKLKQIMTIDTEFVDLCKEYLRLTLVDDLWLANEKTFNLEGRRWLLKWTETRDDIEKKLFYLINEKTKKIKLHPDWKERMIKFEEIKGIYYRSLLRYPIKYETRPWPRITFDPVTGKTMVYQLNDPEVYLWDDPIATQDQIDKILSLHRPFTDDEKKEAKLKLEDRETTLKKEYAFTQDLNPLLYTAEEMTELRRSLKKYPIFREDRIEKLLKARYELLKKSLNGKRLSDLHYERQVLQVNRVLTGLKIWDREFVDYDTSDLTLHKNMPFHLRVINSDIAYRNYLNANEDFFSGNVLYGNKDRYDDPKIQDLVKDLGFEVTSQRILGSSYEPMLKLANDLYDFELQTENFKNLEIKDLPAIDSLYERFELWTFWNDRWRFADYQWFSIKISTTRETVLLHAVIPYTIKSLDPTNWMFEVDKTLKKTNEDLTNRKLTLRTNDYHVNQLLKDLKRRSDYYYRYELNKEVKYSRKIVRYADSLRKANLLKQQTIHRYQLTIPKVIGSSVNKKTVLHDNELPENLVKVYENLFVNNYDLHVPQYNRDLLPNQMDYNNNNVGQHFYGNGGDTRSNTNHHHLYTGGGDSFNGKGRHYHL